MGVKVLFQVDLSVRHSTLKPLYYAWLGRLASVLDGMWIRKLAEAGALEYMLFHGLMLVRRK